MLYISNKNLKTIIIGDVHGEEYWKAVLNKEEFDKVIFLGDYLDSFNIDFNDELSNFYDILYYKNSNPDKVTLLLGNHDYHYINGVKETYSGYGVATKLFIGDVITHEVEQGSFQICCKVDNDVISHAGISKVWLKQTGLEDEDDDKVLDNINNMLTLNLEFFRFNPGRNMSNQGNDITQGPLWIRPPSLGVNARFRKQIIGHTPVHRLNILNDIILADTLNTAKEYLIIEDGKKRVGKL